LSSWEKKESVAVKAAFNRFLFVVNVNVPREGRSHFSAVNTLQQFSCLFFVDFLNVFSPLLLRAEEEATFFIIIALDGLRFVVRSNVSPQISELLFAVDAKFRCCLMVFQNVFFSLFDGQEVRWTSLMEIALDGFISVQFLNVSAQVIYRLFAINALCFTLVNLHYVFLFIFFCLEINSTSGIEVALNFFSLVLIFNVIV